MAKTALGDVCCVSWLHILASLATYWPCILARVEYSILVGGCAITIGTKPYVPDRQRAQPKEGEDPERIIDLRAPADAGFS